MSTFKISRILFYLLYNGGLLWIAYNKIYGDLRELRPYIKSFRAKSCHNICTFFTYLTIGLHLLIITRILLTSIFSPILPLHFFVLASQSIFVNFSNTYLILYWLGGVGTYLYKIRQHYKQRVILHQLGAVDPLLDHRY